MKRPPNETTRIIAARNGVAMTMKIGRRSLRNIGNRPENHGSIIHLDQTITPALPTVRAVGLANVLQ